MPSRRWRSSRPSHEVERTAFEALVSRDLRDILTRLIGMIRKPFEYQVRPIDGPGSAGVLFVEGEKFNVRRIYQSMPIDPSLMAAGGIAPAFCVRRSWSRRARGNTPLMMENGLSPALDQGRSCLRLPRGSDRVVGPDGARAGWQHQPARANSPGQSGGAAESRPGCAGDRSDQPADQLRSTAACCRSSGPSAGRRWVPSRRSGKAGGPTSLAMPSRRASRRSSRPLPTSSTSRAGRPRSSALERGPWSTRPAVRRRSKSIQVGDRVLTQNSTTGALSYQPVMVIHRTKSAATIRLDLDDETIVATGIHRFWKAGEGWTMARDLKPGDRVRMVGGTVLVRSVQPDTESAGLQPRRRRKPRLLRGQQGALGARLQLREPGRRAV